MDDEEQKDDGGASRADAGVETKWKCWRCSTLNSLESKCPRCRQSFQDCPYADVQEWLVSVPRGEEAAQTSNSGQKTTAADNMAVWKCSNCNYTNRAGQKYCDGCRQATEKTSTMRPQRQEGGQGSGIEGATRNVNPG